MVRSNFCLVFFDLKAFLFKFRNSIEAEILSGNSNLISS
jgi:hypothetical protein